MKPIRLAVFIAWEAWCYWIAGETGLWAGFILFGLFCVVVYTCLDAWRAISHNRANVNVQVLNVDKLDYHGPSIKGQPDPTGPNMDEWGAIVEVNRRKLP